MNIYINRGGSWSIVLSMSIIMAGVLGIVMSSTLDVSIVILFGLLVAFSGGTHLVYACHTRNAPPRFCEALWGIMYLGAGAYLLMHPLITREPLMLVVTGYLGVETVLKLILMFELSTLAGSGWLLFDWILTFILAQIIICRTWFAGTFWVIEILVGVGMLFGGVARLMVSIGERRAANAVCGEVIDLKQGEPMH